MKSRVVFSRSCDPRWPPERNVYMKPIWGYNFVLDWDIDFNFFLLCSWSDHQKGEGTRHCRKWSKLAENCRNGWKLPKTAGNCQKRPEIGDWSLPNLLLFVSFVCYVKVVTYEIYRVLKNVENGRKLQKKARNGLIIVRFSDWFFSSIITKL